MVRFFLVGATNTLIKILDYETRFYCTVGVGILREEVWRDRQGSIVKYNLAFINHSLCKVDNGRVLGYDNAHGRHERHSMGRVHQVGFTDYKSTSERFFEEVEAFRKGKS